MLTTSIVYAYKLTQMA